MPRIDNYPTRSHRATVIYKDHRAIARSKNLRGILDYARKLGRELPYYIHPVRRVRVFFVGAGKYPRADVLIEFADGATCLAYFESWSLAVQWILSRRSWGTFTQRIGVGFSSLNH